MMIKVSRHAEMRIKERQGLNKKAIERMAQKAFDKGIKHNQTKGRLNKWLHSQCRKQGVIIGGRC